MTLYSQPSDADPWRCPECGRVEEWSGDHPPRCTGTPERPHAGVDTVMVFYTEDPDPTDDRGLFQ